MLQQEGWLASLNEHCILCCDYFESNTDCISSNFGTSQNLKKNSSRWLVSFDCFKNTFCYYKSPCAEYGLTILIDFINQINEIRLFP